jgi:hypothetical protein
VDARRRGEAEAPTATKTTRNGDKRIKTTTRYAASDIHKYSAVVAASDGSRDGEMRLPRRDFLGPRSLEKVLRPARGRRSAPEIAALLRALSQRSTLHIKRELLREIIAQVEAKG